MERFDGEGWGLMSGYCEMRRSTSLGLRARDLPMVLLFCFFLYPISIEGDSANYSFMLYPIFGALFSSWKLRKPKNSLLLLIAFYALVFILASLYQYNFVAEWPRRVVSFILFMSMFAFMFVKIDERMVKEFMAALIIIAIYFSLSSIDLFFTLGGSALHFEAKDLVGGQRFGFIYIMALWVILLTKPQSIFEKVTKPIFLLIVMAGVLLTFSRASIIALLSSFVVFSFWILKNSSRLSFFRVARLVAIGGLAVSFAFYLLHTFFPIIFDFFDLRLVDYLLNTEGVEGDLMNADTSGGTRVFIWKNIVEFVLNNPLTGSGYLGIWILDLFGTGGGSSHSQYFDVLFRVGVIGLLFYLYLLYRAGKFLCVVYPPLYWGFIGVFFYGFFHETFKESHGGFVLAFLLGMMSQMQIPTHLKKSSMTNFSWKQT